MAVPIKCLREAAPISARSFHRSSTCRLVKAKDRRQQDLVKVVTDPMLVRV